METLDAGRIGIAAQALGIAESAFEEAVIILILTYSQKAGKREVLNKFSFERFYMYYIIIYLCKQ